MSSLTLEQAARASGRSPREIRLLLEEGRLRGAVLAGRWQVEPSEVDGLLGQVGVGAPPDEQPLRVVPPPGEVGGSGSAPSSPRDQSDPASAPASGAAATDVPAVEELVSRLEQRAIEVARLRGELEALREGRDEHGARVERELDGLRRELSNSNAQLDRARERIEELEAELRAGERAASAEKPAPQPRRPGMSDALSPLFRPT